jgi:hypothetical protein
LLAVHRREFDLDLPSICRSFAATESGHASHMKMVFPGEWGFA